MEGDIANLEVVEILISVDSRIYAVELTRVAQCQPAHKLGHMIPLPSKFGIKFTHK